MKTAKGYKLFEYQDGDLYPLFINAKESVPMNEWIPAIKGDTRGKFAPRPGWHIGTICDAAWLKGYDGTERGCYKSKRGKGAKRVWCEVEYITETDWQPVVEASGKKWLDDQIPVRGYYHFKEAGNRPWIIAGELRVTRILTEEERQDILQAMGYDEIAAYAPKKRGFERRLGICQA